MRFFRTNGSQSCLQKIDIGTAKQLSVRNSVAGDIYLKTLIHSLFVRRITAPNMDQTNAHSLRLRAAKTVTRKTLSS